MSQSIPTLISKIDEALPQTQCERCGYKGCKPYAEAVVRDGEAINLCQPGGQATTDLIAHILGRKPEAVIKTQPSQVAFIREDDCIGCTKCIQACPVDAIVGSSKSMHTVITSDCTGCELCLPPCPTLCIELKPTEHAPKPLSIQAAANAQYFKSRYIARKERLAKQQASLQRARNLKQHVDIKSEILKSISRVNAKRAVLDEPTKA